MASLTFTIILPVCHGGILLQKALESLRKIDFPPERVEILIAGAHDNEQARQIVAHEAALETFPIAYVMSNSSQRAVALNAACRAATGRIWVFTDDDCLFPPEWLRQVEQVFLREPDVGMIGGQDRLESDDSTFDLALDHVLNSLAGSGGIRRETPIRAGTYYPRLWNMVISRDVAMEVALTTGEHVQVFNEALHVQEDVELGKRIATTGRQLIFAPEICVAHWRDTTFWSFIKRSVLMARTSRTIGVHRIPHLILSVGELGMMLLALGAWMINALWMPFGILIGIYGSILVITSIQGAIRTRRLAVGFVIPLVLIALHLARGIGYLFPLGKIPQS